MTSAVCPTCGHPFKWHSTVNGCHGEKGERSLAILVDDGYPNECKCLETPINTGADDYPEPAEVMDMAETVDHDRLMAIVWHSREEYKAVLAIIGPPPEYVESSEPNTPITTSISSAGGSGDGNWIQTTGGGLVQGDPNLSSRTAAYQTALQVWQERFKAELENIRAKEAETKK